MLYQANENGNYVLCRHTPVDGCAQRYLDLSEDLDKLIKILQYNVDERPMEIMIIGQDEEKYVIEPTRDLDPSMPVRIRDDQTCNLRAQAWEAHFSEDFCSTKFDQ